MNGLALYLASASPRRRKIMQALGVPFRTVRPRWQEPVPLPGTNPASYALANARAKAKSVRVRAPTALVVGVDTVVALGSVIMGKPSGRKQVEQMIRDLSGRTHQVITAVAVHSPARGRTWSETETSLITFHKLEDARIRRYALLKEPLDKAGAYAIQGHAREFVASISGSYFNVVGLPVVSLLRLLAQAANATRTTKKRRAEA